MKNFFKNYFENTSLWIHFLVGFVVSFCFWVGFLYYCSFVLLNAEATNPHALKYLLISSGVMSVLVSFIVTQNIRDSRANKRFWILAHEFEEGLNNGKTQDELDLLRPKHTEMLKLRFGIHHNYETTRLKDLFDMKYNLIPKSK